MSWMCKTQWLRYGSDLDDLHRFMPDCEFPTVPFGSYSGFHFSLDSVSDSPLSVQTMERQVCETSIPNPASPMTTVTVGSEWN